MSNICLTNTDFASSTILDAASGRSGSVAKPTSTPRTTQEGGKVFRDLLGAMTQKGKAEGKTSRPGTVLSPQSQSPSQVLLAATAAPDRKAAVDDGDPADLIEVETSAATVAGSPDNAVCALVSALVAGVPGATAPQRGEQNREEGEEDILTSKASAVAASAAVTHRATTETSKPWTFAELRAALLNAADSGTTATAAPQAASSTDADFGPTGEAVEFRAAAPAKVTVIAQETYFAPVTTTGVVDQIADAIMAELPNLADQTVSTANSAAVATDTLADRSPMRVLIVRLDPPELGEVTVNLRLKGDSLELRVSATNQDTVRLLQMQRDKLSDLMRDTGYVSDIASVQVADVQAAPSSGGSAQLGANMDRPGSPPSNLADGRRQSAGDGGEGGRESRPDRQQSPSGRHDRAVADSTTARSSAIYL